MICCREEVSFAAVLSIAIAVAPARHARGNDANATSASSLVDVAEGRAALVANTAVIVGLEKVNLAAVVHITVAIAVAEAAQPGRTSEPVSTGRNVRKSRHEREAFAAGSSSFAPNGTRDVAILSAEDWPPPTELVAIEVPKSGSGDVEQRCGVGFSMLGVVGVLHHMISQWTKEANSSMFDESF